ncbi:MAG TPA: hypothetical protein DFR83_01350, partial [Deltaproteobacteria bacterium]|nr:hypothetical protein [Deltaproteobacteria bacterium]
MPALLDASTTVTEQPYAMDPRWRDLVAGARVPRRMRVLLVNATKGAALYQSLIDFIVLWQSVEPQLHITNA